MNSMTGYGKGELNSEDRRYVVQIKSVNSKYLDVNIKLPKNLSIFEEDIRKLIVSHIARGKVEFTVQFDNFSQMGKKMCIDEELVKSLLLETQTIANKYHIENDIKMSNIISMEESVKYIIDEQSNEILKKELQSVAKEAIDNFIEMRNNEGKQIKKDIVGKIEILKTNIEKIENLSYNIVDEYKSKIESRLEKYMQENDIDKNRILTEIVIFADKMTIDEEIIRFKAHINQFTKELDNTGAIGKKLDFIIQELNRETNTIGSKTNNLEISNIVIVNKGILENIREQIQNIE